jgi:uncharacterized membrane protein
MNEFISLLLITIIFIILDTIWFSSWALKNIYDPTFTSIQGSPLELRIGGGIIAWFLLAVGIRYFALNANDTNFTTFCRGALLGFVIYGVYNGTNYATFTKYPLSTAIADTLWGSFVVGIVSVIAKML